jgi:hypothetical protein
MQNVTYIGGMAHTPEVVADIFLETLGTGNKCLEKWHFTFTKAELLPWLQTLTQDDLEILTEALIFFSLHMEPIVSLIDKGLKKSYTPQEIFAAHAWSKYATITIFSVVEGLISRKGGVASKPRLIDFLKSKLAKLKTSPTAKELDGFETEYQSLYPGSQKRIKDFYASNLPASTIAGIVSSYRSWEAPKKTFDDLDDVLEDLYGPIRSGFVHQMGREALQIEPIIGNLVPEAEGGGIKFYDNLTPQEFICMTWRAILTSFGYVTNTSFSNT